MDQYNGVIPQDYKKFMSSGVGEYSGSCLSIAFDKKIPAIDGNVKRVMSRYLGIKYYSKKL